MSEKITFYKSNWTDDLATLTVDEDKFILDGLDSEFSRWRMTTDDGLIKMINQVTGIAYLGFQNFRSEWFGFQANGVSREDKNPMVAFAQLIWNLV